MDACYRSDQPYRCGNRGHASRRTAVRELTDAGMTTREVGAALGVDHATVVRDLQAGANAPGENAPGPTHFHMSGERFEAYPGREAMQLCPGMSSFGGVLTSLTGV